MMIKLRTLGHAATLGVVLCSTNALAASDPSGLWLDHNGRGAVEISPCADGNGLCGYVVHIKDPKNTSRCGLQILGNVTPAGGGWIYSPERKRKYPVALKRLSDDNLRVVGNAGSMFSRTFTWNRAPDHVARCGETVAAVPKAPVSQPAEPAADTTPIIDNRETEATISAAPLHSGASSGALALMASPKRASEAPYAAPPPAPEAMVAEASAPDVDQVATREEGTAAETFDAEPETRRMCKFRIPYVGRTIEVPCRD